MYYFSLRTFLKLLFCIIPVLLLNNYIIAQGIEGYVFVDSNNNSIMDPGERGLNGVKVSNQKDVVITDDNGHFQIKPIEGNYIFVTKPESFQFKLDMFNNPEFYFLYKTKDIKQDLRYSSPNPINEIPQMLYFPVYENEGEDEHSCLLIADPQMRDDRRLGYYKDGVLPYMATKDADFYVLLGDIAYDYLGILPKERLVSSSLGIPGYRVPGNHDINFKATRNKYAAETFNLIYGPDNYSFDYGSFHYIILNTIIYEGWQKDIRKAGGYYAGLMAQQKKWLVNDLKHVPENKTIVLLSHVSLHDIFIMPLTMRAVFKALENHKKILAVSGHMHRIITYDYTAEQGWKNNTGFEGLVAGAASGAWWSGALDENNIPYSICLDGSPKGFFQLNTKGEDYNYVFHAADDTTDLQMRIYLKKDEIRVNWFVGKRTDSVWVYINDNPIAIKLQNFMAEEPLAKPYSNDGTHVDYHTLEFEQVAHLWKAKLTENLLPGKHTVKVVARDSKGKVFNEYKVFYLDKE